MEKISYKSLIFMGLIFLLGGCIAHQAYWKSQFDYSQTIRNQLDASQCEPNGCQIKINNVDKWIYFRQFVFDFSEQCQGLVIDDKLKSYMEDNLQCDFLVGFKDNQARQFIKGHCQSENNDKAIFFEKYLTPTEIQNHPAMLSDKLADYQAIGDIENGDVFKSDVFYGIKFDGSLYTLQLRKIANVSNLNCFRMNKSM